MTANLPAYLQQYSRGAASSALDSLTKMSTGSQPYISIQGNRFQAVDALGEKVMVGDIDRKAGTSFVDVVIIDANPVVSKVYYDVPFDPNANDYMPPACWSDNGVAPSTQAGSPQCRSCAECPHAVWGSKVSSVSGKGIKECGDTKKIAVYIVPVSGDDGYDFESMPFLVRVPPASLKGLADHARKLAANNATVAQVVTRMSFAPDGVGVLLFEAARWITEDEMADIDAIEQGKLDLLVNKNDLPRTGELPPPAGQKALASQQQGNGTPPPNKPQTQGTGLFNAGGGSKPSPEKEPDGRDKTTEELIAEAVAAALAKAGAAPATEPAKRKRRTAAEIAADEAAKKGGQKEPEQTGDMFGNGPGPAGRGQAEEMEVPAFLNGGKAGATAPIHRAGGQKADAPSPDLEDALNKAFSLNLQG